MIRPKQAPENISGACFRSRGHPLEKAGLYVHIPFCLRKCRYCDFYSITDLSQIDAFLACLIREIHLRSQDHDLLCDTIYIGGGTPSVMNPAHIETILGNLFRCFRIAPNMEITLEANPGTVDSRRLRELHALGIHRLQLGVQSFQDPVLQFLGRIHTAREAEHALLEASSLGGWKVGADLIYNIPIRDRRNLANDLDRMIRIQPLHLSSYSLTIEEGTDLYEAMNRKEFQILSEEEEADRFGMVSETLEYAGYTQYEVSNFAFNGSGGKQEELNRSRHNRKYWTGAPYLGFGPGAHSYIASVRSWNDRNWAGYMRALSDGKRPPGGYEVLTRENRITEAVFLGLRTLEGIDVSQFRKDFDIDLVSILHPMMDRSDIETLLIVDETCVRLTRNGWAVLDAIVRHIIDRIFASG